MGSTEKTENTECPICRGEVSVSRPRSNYFPFCSERCQLVDLSHWLDESYRIPERSGEP